MVLIRCVNVKLSTSSNGYVPACCLMTTIVIVLCTGSKHEQIHQKYEKVIYKFGIQDFGVAFSMWHQRFKILKSLSTAQSRNSAALSNSRRHNS
jgi:hypothetical protein